MDLVLDIGNSRTKVGLFASGRLTRAGHIDNGDLAAVRSFLLGQAIERIALGSVAEDDPVWLEGLRALAPVTIIRGDTPAPVHMAYSTKGTLGVDRLANAVGASSMFPRRPVLAIGMGTCTIYDLVDAGGTYRGGVISPGLRMRAQAMHDFTARLPEVRVPDHTPGLVGTSTEECIASGAFHGLRAELSTLIAEFGQQHPGLAVVLTGGDAQRFTRALENGIFAHPFLTLAGLHALLHYDPPRHRAGAR